MKGFKPLLAIALLTAVIVGQETRWALVPPTNTRDLWISMAVALIAYAILRSGWGAVDGHAAEQRALGTLSNSFYEPRRSGILTVFTIGGGVTGAMWWGVTAWITLVRGIEREAAARGLVNLQASVVVGIIAGALTGAALGLVVGEVWERRHRARRRRPPPELASTPRD